MSGSRLEDELAKLRELVQELEDERAELTPSELWADSWTSSRRGTGDDPSCGCHPAASASPRRSRRVPANPLVDQAGIGNLTRPHEVGEDELRFLAFERAE